MNKAGMSEWKKYKLGNLINVKHGFAFKGEFFSDQPTQDILLTPGNFKIGGGFKADKFKYYNGDYPADYILKEGDILITMTDLSKAGDTLGYSAKIPKHSGIKYLHNQRLGLVQFKSDEIDPDFLYWVLRTKPYQFYIVGSATGSTVKHTSPTRICSYEFQAPKDIEEQRQIAQILSSLDDKIELNLQMNQTLEAMAQAIFKEWFVNFNFPGFDGELVDGLPKGWKKITLDEIAKVKNGFAFKGTDFINEGIPVIKIKNVKPNKILLNDLSYVSREVADKANKYLINQDDILITMSGNRMNGTPDTWVGKVALFQRNGEYLLNQRVSVIDLIPDYSHLKYYLTILLSSIEFQNYFISSATSSGGQANISPALIYCTEIILPDLETSKKFYLTMKSFYDKNLENELQIESLTQTRDTLLPKLMSGQLEVV
ncbi:restriction endonuclease subunit S [Petrimonas sp.]|uniref:restriction endonuclease subunit S n=1 Tax=Petrimonas sp. TaxID=2023866 RepID=UPI003F510467